MADFYWNMSRLCSNSIRNLIEEICFSDRHFFYRRKQELHFHSIDLSLGSQINIDMSQECEAGFDRKVATFNNVKSFFHIFRQFSLIQNTCYVSHGPILSQYNTIVNTWTAHLRYAVNIRFLFRYNVNGVY
jgi:hypothetical protein